MGVYGNNNVHLYCAGYMNIIMITCTLWQQTDAIC